MRGEQFIVALRVTRKTALQIVRVRFRLAEGFRLRLDRPLEERGNELFLAAEMAEERDLVDVRRIGNLARGRAVQAAFGTNAKSGIEKALAGGECSGEACMQVLACICRRKSAECKWFFAKP